MFHQGITELRRCENCVFFLPINILTGVARRLLGPHDTLPCVLITVFTNEAGIEYLAIKEGSQDNQGNLLYQLSHKPLECRVMQKYPFKASWEYT